MVLTVGYHYDHAALLTLGAETAYTCGDGLTQRSALDWDRLGGDRIQEHLRRDVVCRDRELDE